MVYYGWSCQGIKVNIGCGLSLLIGIHFYFDCSDILSHGVCLFFHFYIL